MSVTATCGHELTDEEGMGFMIAIKDYSRDGSRAISYPSLCTKCFKRCAKSDELLANKTEEEEWLNNEIKRQQ